MLRRLAHHQPDSFAFTPANQAWAEAQIRKYPEGRQASAVIPLLWRAQEQEGWLSRPAIEHVADMLGMAYIRALEVATFYFMFQLHPVGKIANIQICGTLSCMLCGAEDLVGVCKDKIAPEAHSLSQDGAFSWEEVECLGACANAPMAQIGKDYYEDLTTEKLAWILDELRAGRVPPPGPQNGRFASEPKSGLTSLAAVTNAGPRSEAHNGSLGLALGIGDTVKRIDGTEVPLVTPWIHDGTAPKRPPAEVPVEKVKDAEPKPGAGRPVSPAAATVQEADAAATAKPIAEPAPDAAPTPVAEAVQAAPSVPQTKPQGLAAARDTGADDLKLIIGIGPVLEKLLHTLGFYHFDQIAAWTESEIAWVNENLEGFKGRVSRDKWIEQARVLAKGGSEDDLRTVL